MKRLLFLVFILSSLTSFGQFLNYTNINGRYKWIAGKFDSTFTIPSGTTPSLRVGGGTGPGALFYSTTDSTVYQYTGTQWTRLRGSDTAHVISAYVRNTTASAMTPGQVVYINGSTGTTPTIALAVNKQDSTSAMTFGFVRGNIPVNGFGYITTFGPLEGVNTNAYDEGEVIYLDSIPGQFTHDKPQAPYHMVTLGYIIKKSGGNGTIYAKVQNGYELDELHNVKITAPVLNKSLLVYDSVKALWVDSTYTAAGLGPTGSGTTNYVSKWTGSTALGNSLIQDDGTNVAIGTTPATYKFRVSGNVFSSSYFVGTTTNTLDQFKSGGLISFASSGTSSYTQIGYDATLNSGWITAVTEGSAYRPIIIGYSSNVGISTTAAPTSRLEIQSSNFPAITLRKTGVGTWNLGNRTEGSGTQMNISYGTTDILNVTAAGRVLIGTINESTYELEVVGDMRVSTEIYANNSTIGFGGIRVKETSGGYGLVVHPNASTSTYTQYNASAIVFWNGTVAATFSQIGGSLYSDVNTANAMYHRFSNTHVFTITSGGAVAGASSLTASAVLEATSTTKGFLPPRMTNAQMVAITTPAAGLVVYDTTNNKLNVYDGSNWVAVH
jgi:hypothetical protein